MCSKSFKNSDLQQIFSKTSQLLEAKFQSIAESFTDIDPATFPNHIKKMNNHTKSELISDIAQLEFYLHHSYQNKVSLDEPINIASFLDALEEAPDAISLVINPNVRLLRSKYQLDKIITNILTTDFLDQYSKTICFATVITDTFPDIVRILPETFETIELGLLNTSLEDIYAEIFEDKSPKIFEKVLREMIDNNILIDFEMKE